MLHQDKLKTFLLEVLEELENYDIKNPKIIAKNGFDGTRIECSCIEEAIIKFSDFYKPNHPEGTFARLEIEIKNNLNQDLYLDIDYDVRPQFRFTDGKLVYTNPHSFLEILPRYCHIAMRNLKPALKYAMTTRALHKHEK